MQNIFLFNVRNQFRIKDQQVHYIIVSCVGYMVHKVNAIFSDNITKRTISQQRKLETSLNLNFAYECNYKYILTTIMDIIIEIIWRKMRVRIYLMH